MSFNRRLKKIEECFKGEEGLKIIIEFGEILIKCSNCSPDGEKKQHNKDCFLKDDPEVLHLTVRSA